MDIHIFAMLFFFSSFFLCSLFFFFLFLVNVYAKLQLCNFKSRNIISLIVSFIILSPFVIPHFICFSLT